MADAQQDPSAQATVELMGYLEEAPSGFVRLVEETTRDGRYVDIEVKDIVSLLPEEGAEAAAAQTVIAVRGDARLLICTPVAAGELDDTTVDEVVRQPDAVVRPDDHEQGWPRRGGHSAP